MNTILKHIKIFGVQLRNNFVREAVYRSNFLTAIIVDLVWIGVEFSLFSILYSNTPTLAGWTKHQVYFFLGVFFSVDALFSIFFQTNFWMFSDLVNKGELDILLTKPAHPLFLALTRWMNLTAGFNFILGLIIFIKYSNLAGFDWASRWYMVIIWFSVGLFAQLMLRFIFSIWIFWTDRGFALSRMYYQFFQIATKPDTIYPKLIRYTILTALPFAFIGSVPARALLGELSHKEILNVFIVLTILFTLNGYLWKKGLKRYQSASS